MKILMLTSGTIHSTLSHRLLSLARDLVRRGHQVSIIAPRLDKYSNFQLDNPAEIDGVKLIYPYQFKTRSAFFNLIPYMIACTWKVLRAQADVVYLYKPTPITITGILAKWLLRQPLVLDMDDLGSEVMQIERQPAPVYKLVEGCEKLAAKHANAIVAASTLLEDHYHHLVPKTPILRLPNGVEPASFTPHHSKRIPHIVFFGALNRERIVRPILDALPKVIEVVGEDNVHLDILGDGSCRPELEATTHKLGLEAAVTFHGWSTYAQFSKLAASGDLGLCIMPNERTTAACSNQKVFQYMASGLCVVATQVGDLPLYLENGAAGALVNPDDPTALARILADLLKNSSKRTQLAERGRSLAKTTYSWHTLGGQVEVLLQTLTTPVRRQVS